MLIKYLYVTTRNRSAHDKDHDGIIQFPSSFPDNEKAHNQATYSPGRDGGSAMLCKSFRTFNPERRNETQECEKRHMP